MPRPLLNISIAVGLLCGLPALAQKTPTTGLPPAPDVSSAEGTPPQSLGVREHAAVVWRLRRALAGPPEGSNAAEAMTSLDGLLQDAVVLLESEKPGPLRTQALEVLLQGLYARIAGWPDDPQTQTRISELRAMVLFAAAEGAAAQGDFWQLSLDLVLLKRSEKPAEAQRGQAKRLLQAYLVGHPDAAPSGAVRGALEALTGAAEEASGADGAGSSSLRPAYTLGPRTQEAGGVERWAIRSRYQSGPNALRMVRPKRLEEGRTLLVVFLLPTEPSGQYKLGDPLQALRKADLHNRYGLVAVSPTLNQRPWYADHPGDAQRWQATYIAQAVVPAVDELLGLQEEPPRRVLVGFSTGGWGTVNVLLGWPAVFDAAAVWDAPLLLDAPDRYDMQEIFPTRAHFHRQALPAQFRAKASLLRKRERLVLMGHDLFADHMAGAHALLKTLRVPHRYIPGPRREHRWDSGWLADAVGALVEMKVEE